MSETRSDDQIWTRRTGVVIACLLVLRVAYIAIVPLELCPDEAYYWDWSRQLDWCYYSKPPMIAWLIALATRLGGNSEFVIRLPAAVLSSLGLIAVFGLGRSQFSARVGFWSVVALAATPGFAAMGLLMTIDAPFLCAWACAVWAVWELLSPAELSWRRVLPAVIATGLGLLSKQTMLAIFPLTVCWLLAQPGQRRKLMAPQVWAWWCGSLLFLTPIILWNAQQGWVTMQHTSEHFQNRDVPLMQHAIWLLEFWGSQFGVTSPFSCGLMLTVAVAALLSLKKTGDQGPEADQRVSYLICLGLLPFLGVTVLSATQRVQPNWPAPFWLTLFVLLAAWGCEHLPRYGLRGSRTGWFHAGVAVGLLFMVGTYAVPFVLPQSTLSGGPLDATARLRGWKTLGDQVGLEFGKLSNTPSRLCISVTGRGPVSALAYYLPEQPRVYRWNPTGIVESQHEIWGGPSADHQGAEVLIVAHPGQPIPAELAAVLNDLQPVSEVAVHLGGKRHERLQLWRGTNYRGWPQRSSMDIVTTASAVTAGDMRR